jgi:probable HAF family extracellular repeat protein
MKNRNRSIFALALILLAQVAISTISRAAEPRYRLIDLGSLGGHLFYPHFSGVNGRLLNNDRTVVGGMSTTDADPFGWNSDPFTSHAFEWQNGSLTDLGATAFNDKANFSQAFWLNDLGHSVGIATYNASTSAVPLFKAVLWKDRQMIDVGTLGGNQSYAHAINNRDQTVGWALDTVASSEQIWFDYPFPFLTQQRAALWENGSVRDLGTLGGPCAWAMGINGAGQIIGQSHTAIATGTEKQIGEFRWARPVAGFIWQNGTMVDLGNLGGTFVLPLRINQQGQVIGIATRQGDTSYHPFLWDQGLITDLGTLGGNNGSANDMNDAGEVVGGTDLAGGGFHAFLWKNGVMKDLGSVRQRSQAWHINAKSQIVGTTGDGFESSNRAFLWENSGPMVDLNTLISQGSQVTLRYPLGINDAGEILCYGVLQNGDSHPFLLIPLDPRLSVERSGANVVLSWPTNVVGYTLQLTTSLTSPVDWIDSTNTPAVVGTQFTVTNATSASRQFYRLIKQ